jgi:carbohydrate-binding DOMON domain-containing protein
MPRKRSDDYQLGLFEDRVGCIARAEQHIANMAARPLDAYQQREQTAAMTELATAKRTLQVVTDYPVRYRR